MSGFQGLTCLLARLSFARFLVGLRKGAAKWTSFENGKAIGRYFNTLDELIGYRGRKLHAAERSLLAFMKRSAKTS